MSNEYQGGYTRRQELTCTEAQIATYADLVLHENEKIYVRMNSGVIRMKLGDGKTGLGALPYTKVYDGDLATVEAWLESKFDKANVAQELGNSEEKVVSQKTATKEFDKIKQVVTHRPFEILRGSYSTNGVGNPFPFVETDNRLTTTPINREFCTNGNIFDVSTNSGYLIRAHCLDEDGNLIKSYDWGARLSANIADESIAAIIVNMKKEDDSNIFIEEFWNALDESYADIFDAYNILTYACPCQSQVQDMSASLRIPAESIYNESGNISGYYNADGTVVESELWVHTAPIKIGEGIFYCGMTKESTAPMGVYFDKNRVIIGTFKQTLGDNIFIKKNTENATYVAFSVFTDDLETFNVYESEFAKMTDYAKKDTVPVYNQYNLNINLFGCDDMIWSWWYYPIVYSFNRIRNKLYWGYTTNDGYTGIAEYDFNTQFVKKTHLKKSDVDDHNALAIMVMDDGKIMCAYAGGHNTDEAMHIRLSKTPECIDFFADEIVLTSSGNTSYGQIIKAGSTYYLFYRVGNMMWAYRTTTDGYTWTDEKILIRSTMQYYCNFKSTTVDGLIRICMTSNPASEDSNIRMGFFNTTTGKVLNADGSTSLGSGNVNYSLFDIIIPNETDKTQRLFDVAITAPDKPLILYAPFSTNTDSVYKLYDSGVVHTICNGGSAIWNPKYQCGASFLGTDKIVAARGWDGTDFVEIYQYENNIVTLSESVYSEVKDSIGVRNARPIVDVNGRAFLWHRGYYNPDTYTDFNTDAMIHVVD